MLEAVGLKKHYPAPAAGFSLAERTLKAVDGIDLTIRRGEIVAVVGESGSGKSTLGRMIVRLTDPTEGTIRILDRDVTTARGRDLQALRRDVQIVFQDPFGSLNPRMTAGRSIGYPLQVTGLASGRALTARVNDLLERVGLSAAHADRLPHELSGGQRQRVGIARAIALEPKLLVLDEPVAALDLSAQARVLNLFKTLQRDLGMAYLFITHDLGVAEYMADRIVVMYAGKLMEAGRGHSLFTEPRHPYTRALLAAAVLDAGSGGDDLIIDGDPPSTIEPPLGCRFESRCPYAARLCAQEPPAETRIGEDHMVACHLAAGRIPRPAGF